jgi:Mrp family chromosome partitioning ATPase
MTEHSKIPLPGANPQGGRSGKSLFERADDTFGLGGFKAAPVPAALAEPTNRPVQKAAPAVNPTPVPQTPAPEPVVAAPAPASAAPFQAAPAVVRPSEAKTQFTAAAVQAIDRAALRDNGLIVPDGSVTALLEEFRIVKRQVLLAARDARNAGGGAAAQRVLVCSPLPGEGKTFCAVNLALAIAAEKDSEVLLVDADFARPSVPALLGLAGGKGLMDALADPGVRIEDCVIATDVPGLYVLPAGERTVSDSEFLASGRTSDLLDRLTAGAPNRVVIFDSPPALAASPAAELAPHVGQALVICRADRTGQSALEDALSLLSACPDIKLLLNAAHFSPSGRRFGAYYAQG